MFFPVILLRVLFAACMVFVIGYVFGGFSRNATLTTITKIASILAIVLFIATNVVLVRAAFFHNQAGVQHSCWGIPNGR